ncbi:MAG: hypothetical protein Q7R30_12720 [Acidobacteriota bacterium]|nr:hypothetical protein [Acidobacteriota bacterium]
MFVLVALTPSSTDAQTSTNQSSSAVTPAPVSVDPATASFTGQAGVILITIKPAMTDAYELVIHTLQGALAKDTDEARRAATKGWRVFKASEGDAKGNAVYVHLFLPAVPGFDYRPSLLIDALVKDLAPDLLTKYQESIAGAPSKLSLTELANMAVAPVVAPAVKKPGGR